MTISTASEAGEVFWLSHGIVFTAGGRLVVAGGGTSAALVGLEADGAPDPVFGDGGFVLPGGSG